MKWGKENQELLLHDTKFVGGQPKDGAVYGFSLLNASGNEGYVLIRNPTQDDQNYSLALDPSIGLTADGEYSIKTVYPYKYAYDRAYAKGDSQKIELEGFQTLVLHVTPYAQSGSRVLGARYEVVEGNETKILRIWGSGKEQDARIYYTTGGRYENLSLDFCNGPSYIQITGSQLQKSASSISGSFQINSSADYNASLVVLVNSTTEFTTESTGTHAFTIDGSAAVPAKKTSAYMGIDPDNLNRSEAKQWCDSPNLLHYWTYLILQIPSGNHAVAFSVTGLPAQPSKSAAIHYKKSLESVDILPRSWRMTPTTSWKRISLI